MNGKLLLDKTTKYWMLLAQTGGWRNPTSKLGFKIVEVTIGVDTRQISIAAYRRGKAIANFCGNNIAYGKDWFQTQVEMATGKFEKDFQLNKLWNDDVQTCYVGFFDSKASAEKCLIESGILDRAIKDCETSLQKHQNKYFSCIVNLSKITKLRDQLTQAR